MVPGGCRGGGLPIHLHLPGATARRAAVQLARAHAEFDHIAGRASLLLSLRMALPHAGAAFVNPFIIKPAAHWEAQLLVIDDSFSMRAGTRMDAKREREPMTSRRSADPVG